MKARNERGFIFIVGALFGVLGGILLGNLGHAVDEPVYPYLARPRIIETLVHGQDARLWTVKVMGQMTASPRTTEDLCAGSLINEIKLSVIYSNSREEIGLAVENRLALNGRTLDYSFGWSLICRFKTMSVHVSTAELVR